ncbi:MAG: hypothetical protein EAX95_12015 [Candidatus Thorarchaeota archaeon]|nr:hypothetical protein [Candidatus Thorarchaeota archaeon]
MSELDSKVVHLVESNVSSIEIIGEMLSVSPDEARTLILRLTESGRLKGHLTEDGCRFFRSDVVPSKAPTAGKSEDLKVSSPNMKPGLVLIVLGFASYMLGNILVRVSIEDTFLWGVGGAITFAGPLIIIAGLIVVSQLASSNELGH